MQGHDIIVIGASAGGVETLSALVGSLPPDLEAAVFVTLHIPAHSRSVLPIILARRGPLPASHPRDGETIQKGHIYIAPPDHHIILRDGKILLSRGARENGHRPAIDPMFRAAAYEYGPRVVGIILSGALGDGTAGLEAIKMRGGVSIVQDPEEALYSGMPLSAIEHAAVDYTLPLEEIAAVLIRLTGEAVAPAPPLATGEDWNMETSQAAMQAGAIPDEKHIGTPSVYGCPDCGGVLWEVQEGEVLRYRCRVGHAWGAETLLTEQSEALEEALWVALRALEESASLSKRLQERAATQGQGRAAAHFEAQQQDALQHANQVRSILQTGFSTGEEVHNREPLPDRDSA